jgi:hypothetical protein
MRAVFGLVQVDSGEVALRRSLHRSKATAPASWRSSASPQIQRRRLKTTKRPPETSSIRASANG